MSKSFSEQELSEIMKEIEALEEDFTEDEFVASSVMKELASIDSEKAIPSSKANVVSLDTKRSASTSSMKFKVEGSLKLELEFEIGGKVIALEVTEKGLAVEMEGGAKFSVPIEESSHLKKAV